MSTYQEFLQSGNDLYTNKKYVEAIAAYDQAILLNPNTPGIYNNKGLALNHLKKYDEALLLFDKSISLNPSLAFSYNSKGKTLLDKKKYIEAIQAFDKAISLEPTDPLPYSNKGNVLKLQKKYDEAINAYDMSIKSNPKYIIAYIGKGNTLQDQKKYQESITVYNTAIEINPNYGVSYNNKGVALKNMKRYDEAIEAYDLAIKINAKFVNPHINKGNVYDEEKKLNEALVAYDMAVGIDNNNLFAYAARGKFYLNINKNSEALKDLVISKNLLTTLNTEDMGEENLLLFKDGLEDMLKLEEAVEKLNQEIQRHQNTTNLRFVELLKEKENLDKKKFEELHKLKVEENKISNYEKKNFENLEREYYELEVKIKNYEKTLEQIILKLEEDIQSKLIPYEKILNELIIRDDLHVQVKARSYFIGMTRTLSNLYISSSLINSGNLIFDEANTPKPILSFLASINYAVESGSIKSIVEFLKEKDLIEYTRKTQKILSDVDTLCRIAGKTAIKIVENENKRRLIYETEENNIRPRLEEFYRKLNIAFNDFLSKDIQKKVYVEVYENAGKKLGNLDANMVIEKYCQEEITTPYSYEDEYSAYVIGLDDLTSASRHKKPDHEPCCCIIY